MDEGMTRREFCADAVLLPALAVAGILSPAPAQAAEAPATPARIAGETPIFLEINGKGRELTVEPRVTLLDALRERLQLTGTKKGCDQGTCGACTVLVNGRRVNACLTLALMHTRDRITTIEGLASGVALHPMQDAFIANDGFQCGYCTPGQIISAVGLVQEGRPLDDASIRRQMSGNICRCGAYANICVAVRDGAHAMGHA
jgi:xanthine dehydrogenase YagT iron-sulfur-binding subunit